jgi:DNA helicase-2/ATP-dependent DNA helicase PcrA
MQSEQDFPIPDILGTLNESQRKAVLNTEGPMMIVAGAGSGKTRVITFRIAHLIHKGVDPFNILALTFTNKAAKEMKDRISAMLGNADARNLWMGTFHSVFAKILRVESDRIGYPQDFTIYDTEDSKNLLKAIIKELNLDDKHYKPSMVYGRISSAKNNLISWQAYQRNAEILAHDESSRLPLCGKIYEIYSNRCFRSAAMDFDDLLFNTNVLFKDHPDVLNKYQHRFRYIMVDEYQDTNYSQYLIVKKLASVFENICVVGDDAQSIYAFRGANIRNILNFKNDYPDLKTFKLEQNYRSTSNIVKAANSLIEKNQDQLEKVIWTQNEEGEKISVSRAFSDNEEGQIVANSIFENAARERVNYDKFAILYRTNSQSRAMEEALRRLGIPYRIYGGLGFFQRKEVKDLLSYWRLAVNPDDEEALKRVINYPARGIGQTTLDRIFTVATNLKLSIWKVIENPVGSGLNFNSATLARINQFVEMIQSFRMISTTKNAYDSGMHIAMHSSLLKELYQDKTPEGINRYENVQELLNGLKEYTSDDLAEESENKLNERLLKNYLQDIALLTGDEKEDKDERPKVSLMTVHASKGLEFPYVYVVGMEENLFPSQMVLSSREELEEERRLFYVAITRAERKLNLSFATSRYRWGTLNYCEPSRFISEIDAKFIQHLPGYNDKNNDNPAWEVGERKAPKNLKSGFFSRPQSQKSSRSEPSIPPKPGLRKLSKISDETPGLQSSDSNGLQILPGMTVRHERFGVGTVEHLEGNMPNTKATISFREAGQKQLFLKFAKLEIVE